MKKRLCSLLLAAVLLLSLIPAVRAEEPLTEKKPHTITDVETEMTFWGWTRYITYKMDGAEVNSLYAGAEYNTWAFLCMEPQDQLKVARWYLPGEDRTEQFGYAGVELLCKTVNDAGGWSQAWQVMAERLENKYMPDLKKIYGGNGPDGSENFEAVKAKLLDKKKPEELATLLYGEYCWEPEGAPIREAYHSIEVLLNTGEKAYQSCRQAMLAARTAGTKGIATWTAQFVCDHLTGCASVGSIEIAYNAAVSALNEEAGNLVKTWYNEIIDSMTFLSKSTRELLSLEGGLGLLLGERSAYQNLLLGKGAGPREARQAVELYRKHADLAYALAEDCYRQACELRTKLDVWSLHAHTLCKERLIWESQEDARLRKEQDEAYAQKLAAFLQTFDETEMDQDIYNQIQMQPDAEAKRQLASSLALEYQNDFINLRNNYKAKVDQLYRDNGIVLEEDIPESVADRRGWAATNNCNVRDGEKLYLFAKTPPLDRLFIMEALYNGGLALEEALRTDLDAMVPKVKALYQYEAYLIDSSREWSQSIYENIQIPKQEWLDERPNSQKSWLQQEVKLEGPRKQDAADMKSGGKAYFTEQVRHMESLQDSFRSAKDICEQSARELCAELAKLPDHAKEQQVNSNDAETGMPYQEAYNRGFRRGAALGYDDEKCDELGLLEQRKVLRQEGERLGSSYDTIMALSSRMKMAYGAAHSLLLMMNRYPTYSQELLDEYGISKGSFDPQFTWRKENQAYAEEFSLNRLNFLTNQEVEQLGNFKRFLSQALGCGSNTLTAVARLSRVKTDLPKIRRNARDGARLCADGQTEPWTYDMVYDEYLRALGTQLYQTYHYNRHRNYNPAGYNSGLETDVSLQEEFDRIDQEIQDLFAPDAPAYVPPTALSFGDAALQADKTLACGETWQRTVRLEPADTTIRDLIWTTGDEQVATVSPEGLITGVSDGVTEITVRAADSVVTQDPVTGQKTYDPAPLTFTVQVGSSPRTDPNVTLGNRGTAAAPRYLDWALEGSVLQAEVLIGHCEPEQLLQLVLRDSAGEVLAESTLDTRTPAPEADAAPVPARGADQAMLSVTAELPPEVNGTVTAALEQQGQEPILTSVIPVKADRTPHKLTVVGGGLSPASPIRDLNQVMPGTRVLLQADPGGENQEFLGWSGEQGSFNNHMLQLVVFIMPDCDATVTAAWGPHVHTPGEVWFYGRGSAGTSPDLHWQVCTGCGERMHVGTHVYGPWNDDPYNPKRTCEICGRRQQKNENSILKRPQLWGTPAGDTLYLTWEPMQDWENLGFTLLLLDKDYHTNEKLERIPLDAEARTYVVEQYKNYSQVELAQRVWNADNEESDSNWSIFDTAPSSDKEMVTFWLEPGEDKLQLAVENTMQRDNYFQADLYVEIVCGIYDENGRMLDAVTEPQKIRTMAAAAMELPKPAQAAEVRIVTLNPLDHSPIQPMTTIQLN